MRLRRKVPGRGRSQQAKAPLDTRSFLAPDAGAWTRRPPIEARCGCRVDFLQVDVDEYAMVLSGCARGSACPVVRYVAWEINRTYGRVVDEIAAGLALAAGGR